MDCILRKLHPKTRARKLAPTTSAVLLLTGLIHACWAAGFSDGCATADRATTAFRVNRSETRGGAPSRPELRDSTGEPLTGSRRIRIGVLANRGPEICLREWGPTADYLAARLSPLQFEIVPLGFEEIVDCVKEHRVDFLSANPSFYAFLEYKGLAHRIATLQMPGKSAPQSFFGGVIFCRADRGDIADLHDLRGKRFAAVNPQSLGGWHAALRELIEHGIEPDRDFSDLAFAGSHDGVVRAVLSGAADAGTVRSSQLERMVDEGLLDLNRVKLLHGRASVFPNYPYWLSTRLYPEWAIAAIGHGDSELSKRVSVALLTMPQDAPAALAIHGAGWAIPQDYACVHDLLRDLRLPPYDKAAPVTIAAVFRQYWGWILAGAGLLFAAVAYGVHVSVLKCRVGRIMIDVAASDARFDQLAEQGRIVVWEVDADGLFTYVSRGVQRVLGYRPDELVGRMHFYDLHPEEQREAFKRAAFAVFERKKAFKDLENLVLSKNGRNVWISTNGIPLLNDEGTLRGYRGADSDITDRKRFEDALRESEEKYRQLFVYAISGIALCEMVFDESGKPADYIFLDANPAFEAHTGLRVEDVLGRPATEVHPGIEKTPFIGIYGRIVLSGEPDCFEEYAAPLGRHYHISAFPLSKRQFAVVFTDITDRKRAEARIHEQKRMLQTIFDGIPDVVSLQDIEHTILSYNKAGCDWVGMPLEKIIGRKCYELLGRDSPCPNCTTAAAISTGQTVSQERFIDKWQRWIRATSIPIVDDTGRTTKVVEQLHDITDHKMAQRELEESVAALESANKALEEFNRLAESATRAKSEFLANMSHEIRTPMTAILGYADILLGEPGLEDAPPERVEALHTIQRNGKYLLSLINDILDLTKIEAGKLVVERVACSPSQVLDEVVSLMRVRAEAKNLPLALEYAGPIPETIQSDPLRLRQVLLNLVANAVKFTEKGGIRLAASLARKPGGQPMLRVDVIDSGIGLTREQIAKLFKPFSQADSSTTRKFGGTGLGLTISKRLAEMLGGDISISSEPGKGCVFTVTIETGNLEGAELVNLARETLPPTAPPPPTAAPAAPAATRLDGRILLVEDGPDNQRLIAFVLEKAGASVAVVENGKIACNEALGARDRGEPFDVILMDMQMPVMDGYTAARQLRAEGYAGPIIALTAHAMADDRQKCIDAGCDDYATKPIDRQRLLATVEHWLRRESPVAASG